MPEPQYPLSAHRGSGGAVVGLHTLVGMAAQENGTCGNVRIGHGYAALAHSEIAVTRGTAWPAPIPLGGENALNFDNRGPQQNFLCAFDDEPARGLDGFRALHGYAVGALHNQAAVAHNADLPVARHLA